MASPRAGWPPSLPAPTVLGDYPAIGLADAINVALASEFRIDVIATLDRRHSGSCGWAVRLDELGQTCQCHPRARLIVGDRHLIGNSFVHDEDISAAG
jgi:hypothetical protein